MRIRIVAGLAVALAASASSVLSQDTAPARTPLSIGDYPNVNGLRINFRDRDLGRVNGVNLTVWNPYDGSGGKVRGLALGLPLTGAGDISGVATGVFGAGASRSIRGLMVGPIGAGAGEDISGVGIGGVGIGSGRNIRGIMIGGIGAGAGGDLSGLLVGGIGVGGGGNARGILIGGVGAGVGGNITGLAIGGIGVGAGGRIKGIAIGGIGVGAPRIDGGVVALAAGASTARAVVIAPAFFRIEKDGEFTGASVSTVNYIRGSQRGLSIGVFNYARSVHGIQLGLINIIADSRSHPFLPIINWGSGRD